MSGAIDSLESFWNTWIKPSVCTFGGVAAFTYFLHPTLVPLLAVRLPAAVGDRSMASNAIVSGFTALGAFYLCAKFGL